mmetsp:Transcript_6670/g.11910  ORF Transcript_6670/g.11910 Transcript_6670/m.11910 type:complete len:240 (+) Transcript_6670:64-783(+)
MWNVQKTIIDNPYYNSPSGSYGSSSGIGGRLPPSGGGGGGGSGHFWDSGDPNGYNNDANVVEKLLVPVPLKFEELMTKSTQELESLCHNREALKEFTASHSVHEKWRAEIESCRSEIERLGKLNDEETNSKTADELRSMIETKRSTETLSKTSIEQKMKQKRLISDQLSSENIAARLADALKDAEVAAQELHANFMQGKIDYATFSQEYIRLKKLYYTRNSKLQHVQQLIASNTRSTVA